MPDVNELHGAMTSSVSSQVVPPAMIVASKQMDSKVQSTDMGEVEKSVVPQGFVPKYEYVHRSSESIQLSGGPASVETVGDDDGSTHLDLAGSGMDDHPIGYPPIQLVDQINYRFFVMKEIPVEADILQHDINLLHSAHHADPFSVLGPHDFYFNGKHMLVIRCWVKDAAAVQVRMVNKTGCIVGASNQWEDATQKCDWLFQIAFEVVDNLSNKPLDNPVLSTIRPLYELNVTYHGDDKNQYCLRDAYSFNLLLPSFDLGLFQSGSCWHVDNLMGSHYVDIDGVRGVRFGVWAPNARFVSVVGDFNQWDGRAHPMRKRLEFGVWELFIPNIVSVGHKYGYRIYTNLEADIIKIDPYAQEFENPPAHASVISACDDAYRTDEKFKWTDAEWMEQRMVNGKADLIRRMPMSIYEVHLPSWMRGDGNSYLSYRELAHRLVTHLKNLNFTHVEFLPLAHHPFEGSWGYQVSGLYAPYSRQGNADDLKFLINHLHENGIGVFVDFVPAHFVKDDWGLVYYDGDACYEYADSREGEHKQWGTMVFNFRRSEVRSFILGAAYHWLRRYHIDGLRIDAVSSMLYRDYLRDPGEWIPNEYGGNANLEAISLLQELNWVVHREFPGVFTMAEEATSWAGVTDKAKGLGFDAKWDLGWMNDTISYLCNPPDVRRSVHNKLTFRGLYVSHEKWILPLSHDEVVSGKGSLLDKCGFVGAPFKERLQTLKCLYGYQVGLAGRPLLFMGGEFGQGREWKELRSVDWHEGEQPDRKQACIFLSDLLKTYRDEKPLHAGDDEPWNFNWTDCNNSEDCLVAFIRSYENWYNDILVIANFSGNTYTRYPVGVPHGGRWTVLLNSDDWKYGGNMQGPGNGTLVTTTQGGRLGWPYCLWIDVPAFSCIYLKAPQPDQPTSTQGAKTAEAITEPANMLKAASEESAKQPQLHEAAAPETSAPPTNAKEE